MCIQVGRCDLWRALHGHVLLSPYLAFLAACVSQALQVEALTHKMSGARTSVVVTFDAAAPPTTRSSASLGATLNAVVRAPEASAEYERSAWKREKAASAPLDERLAPKSR